MTDAVQTRTHVAVIGAGIVGASVALELLRDGHQVTIIEPGEPGGEQAASYGNGAWLSPASVVPMSMPGLWRKVPAMLLDPLGPLTIRWTSLLQLLPWLVRFLIAGATTSRVEKTARALSALLNDAPQRHKALASEAGVADLIESTGLLYVYPDRGAFESERLAWRLRRDNGVTWQELDATALHRLEPALHARYQFGAYVISGAHCKDPGAYVGALVRHAERSGAVLRRTKATGFKISSGKLSAVETTDGDIICQAVVVAAGIHSQTLARTAGDRIPLASERGYHVVIQAPTVTLSVPVMPSDGKMANTMTSSGLRASGQVELAGIDATPNWKRADVLLGHLLRTYPGFMGNTTLRETKTWMGHRPSTPDGLPVIGESTTIKNIFYAFGHGHVGLASGPITGRLIADRISHKSSKIAIEHYSPMRF